MIQRIFTMLLMVLLISAACTPKAYSMPYNLELYKSYNYTNKGEPVESPAAYVPYMVLDSKSFGAENAVIEPNDIFVADDNTMYIVDTANSAVYVMNHTFEMIYTISALSGMNGSGALKNPEGVFVNKKGEIYIADTGNNRIVAVNSEGKVLKEFDAPEITVMKDATSYMPTKIVVDKGGRMYITARNINRGLIELDSTGRFKGFMGAPRVVPNMVEYFWKMISTKEQQKRMAKFIPTEYNNVSIDPSGFVYATIGTLDPGAVAGTIAMRDLSGNTTPIRKLNPTGQDVLARKGFFPPAGDIKFGPEGPSIIVDVAVDANGKYSMLDSRKGRIFTYDIDGNLLYVFGGKGKQVGMFQSVSALAYLEDYIMVADKALGRVTVFRITEYGKCINDAIRLNNDGKYDEAAAKWKEALLYNSNLYIAYVGIGKAELRNENYAEAMQNLSIAEEKIYFSKAFRMERKELIYSSFGVIGVLLISTYVLIRIYGWKKKQMSKNVEKRVI